MSGLLSSALSSALRRSSVEAPIVASVSRPAASLVPSANRFSLRWSDFSPFAQQELKFDNYPKNPGVWKSILAILSVNVGVYGAWTWADREAQMGDETRLNFMLRHFVATNQDMSQPENIHRFLTSSVSHQTASHLMGNMTAFLYLAPRLLEFLGTKRFLLLYALGASGGTLATQALHLDPQWEKEEVSITPQRYLNILNGRKPGEAVGLGASDAIAAMFAVFYFTFPRQNVPFFFPKINIFWSRFISDQTKQGSLYYIDRLLGYTKGSAVWVLPMFFFGDFTEIYRMAGYEEQSGLMKASNTGHAAHVGGFLTGTIFYFLVAHPLKARYYTFTLQEAVNRVWIMSLSLSFWYCLFRRTRKTQPHQEEHVGVKKTLLMKPSVDTGVDKEDETNQRFSELCKSPELRRLVANCNECSGIESCKQHPWTGYCSECDQQFHMLRMFLENNTTAPTTAAALALNGSFVDSMAFCRRVLITLPGPQKEHCIVHNEYAGVNPSLHQVSLSASRSASGIANWFMAARFTELSRNGDQQLRASGFVTSFEHDKDKDGKRLNTGRLWLRRVKRGSQADQLGCSDYIGDTVVSINGKAIQTKQDLDAAVENAGTYHLWIQRSDERRDQLRKKRQTTQHQQSPVQATIDATNQIHDEARSARSVPYEAPLSTSALRVAGRIAEKNGGTP